MAQEAGDREQLLEAESRRCQAISEEDIEALERLLDDDLIHVHGSGKAEDKKTYLSGLRGRPRLTTRRDLQVRLLGDLALMDGILVNTFPAANGEAERVVQFRALSVWRRASDGWRQLAFAACGPLAADEAAHKESSTSGRSV